MAKGGSALPLILGGGVLVLVALAMAGGGGGSNVETPKLKKPPVPPRRVPDAFPPLGPDHAHRTSSKFGVRPNPIDSSKPAEFHGGLDIPTPYGTPVYAPVDGVVKYVRGDAAGGNGVCISARGYRWWFFHLTSAVVGQGMQVKRGQVIGLSGSSGRSTGPHLHITIEDETQGGARTDPMGVYPVGTFDRGVPKAASLTPAPVKVSMAPAPAPALSPAPQGAPPRYSENDPDPDKRRMAGEAAEIVRLYRIPQEHADEIVEAADFVGGSGVHLARVMWAESRMKPDAVNPTSGATGLIQFMPTTAAKLGTTTAALRGMTFLQQMRYVTDYLIKVADGEWVPGVEGTLDTQFKMAASVFYPAWMNRDPSTPLPQNVKAANPGIGTMGQYLDFVLAARPPGAQRPLGAPGASGVSAARGVGGYTRAVYGVPRTGALPADRNPCHLFIEAHRVDNRLAQPDREMLITYIGTNDPSVVASCAAELAQRAKRLGLPAAKANAALRASMLASGWLSRAAASRDGGPSLGPTARRAPSGRS